MTDARRERRRQGNGQVRGVARKIAPGRVHRRRERLIALRGVDEALGVHPAQDVIAAFLRAFRVREQVPAELGARGRPARRAAWADSGFARVFRK